FLFMKRMAEVTHVTFSETHHPALPAPLPRGVVVYDVNGPLFFGAAQRAMDTLTVIADRARVVILRMDAVPAMDATGLVALESALGRLKKAGCLAVITGLRHQPATVLRRGNVREEPGRLAIAA